MAKNRKKNEWNQDSVPTDGQAKEIRTESIDVRSEGGTESDSDLDIHALLRKYMPEYDKDEEKEPQDEAGVLSRLKKSAVQNPELNIDDEPADAMSQTDANMMFALDSIFTPAETEVEEALPPLTMDSSDVPEDGEYTFTDDIPDTYEEGGLEDEEGIYEGDEEPVYYAPAKEKKHFSLFGFGKKKDRKKKDFAEDLYMYGDTLPEQPDGYEAYMPDDVQPEAEYTPADTSAGTAQYDAAVQPETTADSYGDPVSAYMNYEETAEDVPAAETVSPIAPAEALFDNTQDTENLIPEDAAANNMGMPDEAGAVEEIMELTLEDAAEEMPAAEPEDAVQDDEFDPTDINLMIAFGMDEGEKKKKKKTKKQIAADTPEEMLQQAAMQAGDRLEARAIAHETHKVKLDRPEFVDNSQIPKIQKEYKAKLVSLWIRLGLCTVFTVLLMAFENIEVFAKLFTGTAKQFGGVFDPAVYPVVYAMVSLQLMLLACLCAYEEIIAGIKYLLRGIPKPESMTGVMMFAGIIYSAVIARITIQADEPVMFNFTVAFAALMTIIAAIYNTKREMLCFKVVSSPKDKHIVCRIPDEQSQCETDAFADDGDVCDVMKIEKAEFIDGFFTRLYTPDGTVNVFMSCIMGIMAAAAVLFGVFAAVRGNTAVEVARIVCVSLMMLAPLPVYLSFSYPFYRANLAAKEYDSAIVGEASLEEYSNASVVTFDDKNVFPSYSVRIQNLRIFNNARIDRVLYYAASVFAHAGGPLQDVFEVATLELGHSDNVKIYDTEAGFLAAEVDGVNIIFGSGTALTRRGLEITREQAEDDVDLSDEMSIMYMFREDKLVCKMYIQYGMDSDIEMILSQFQNTGLYVCVRTFDPNIDERMIARKVRMKRMPLKVVRYASMEEVGAYEEKVDSGLVTCGSPKSLLQVISYCDKVLHTRKTNIALSILAIIIGAAVMTLLVLADSIGLMCSVFIILYQLLWVVPMLFASRMFVR